MFEYNLRKNTEDKMELVNQQDKNNQFLLR
jgi:hypothetical protein